MGINCLIQIGNRDDRLTQAEWSRFVAELRDMLQISQLQIHGEWHSKPDEPWQNANFTVEVLPPSWWRTAVSRYAEDGMNDPMASSSAAHLRDQDMERTRRELKEAVRRLCYRWRQDSFAWTTAPVEIVETGYQQLTPAEARRREELHEAGKRLHREWPDLFPVPVVNLDPFLQAQSEGWLPKGPPGLEDRPLPVSTPGEESGSAPQQPASTGDGDREIPAEVAVCRELIEQGHIE